MNSFNIKRFFQVVRWIFSIYRSSYMKTALGFFIGILLYFFAKHFSSDFINDPAHAYSRMAFNTVGISVIGLLVAMVRTFVPLYKKRQNAIDYMMLPATTLEKFVASEFCTLLGTLLAAVIGFLGADVAQWLIGQVFGHPGTDFVCMHSKMNWILRSNVYNSQLLNVVLTLWLFSFFILGGVLFRKMPALTTWAALFLLVLLAGHFVEEYLEDRIIIHLSAWKMYILCGSAVFTLFNLVVAYRLFKRMPFVSHKRLNV